MSVPSDFFMKPDEQACRGLGTDMLGMLMQKPAAPGLGAVLAQATPVVQDLPASITDPTQDPAAHQRLTLYGETAGLYPQLQAGKSGVYTSGNWDPDSADQLKTAREWMAGVRLVNPVVKERAPNLSNPIEKMVWRNVTDATAASKDVSLPPGVKHFFIRQEGAGEQGPGLKWGPAAKLYQSFGPFQNFGGGDVPKGPKTYIDFYKVGP